MWLKRVAHLHIADLGDVDPHSTPVTNLTKHLASLRVSDNGEHRCAS